MILKWYRKECISRKNIIVFAIYESNAMVFQGLFSQSYSHKQLTFSYIKNVGDYRKNT